MANKEHAIATHKAAQIALRTAKKAREMAADERGAAQRANIMIEVAKEATVLAYQAARRVLKKAMSETGVIRIDKAAVTKEARYEYFRRAIAP